MKKIEPAPSLHALLERGDYSQSNSKDFELAKEFNREYYHWEQLKYKTDDENTRRKIWMLMKMARGANAKPIKIGPIKGSYSLTSDLLEDLFALERSLSGYIEYHGKEVGDPRMRYYSVSSFVEEAISSSILEGAAVTRTDAKRMIRKNKPPVSIDERMIINNLLAMENLKKIKDRKLTPELIKDMHRIIVNRTLKSGMEWEGRFREDNETVVGDPFEEEKVYHVPPTYDKIPQMIEGLCNFANSTSTEFMHPIIKGIIIHYMIGFIHPFIDGNGRLARSLFYWYALKSGYWMMEYAAISKIIKTSRGKYGLAYQYAETDENDLTYFIKFNMECIMRAVKDLEKHIEKKAKEQKEAKLFVEENPELNLREATILKDCMRDDAPFSIVELQKRYRTAYQTVRLDVKHLEDLGLIRPVTKDRQKVLYIVDRTKVNEAAEAKRNAEAALPKGGKSQQTLKWLEENK